MRGIDSGSWGFNTFVEDALFLNKLSLSTAATSTCDVIVPFNESWREHERYFKQLCLEISCQKTSSYI